MDQRTTYCSISVEACQQALSDFFPDRPNAELSRRAAKHVVRHHRLLGRASRLDFCRDIANSYDIRPRETFGIGLAGRVHYQSRNCPKPICAA
jgi:hypothetical protein